jgi:N-acyl-D-aspartate/D-glutamate deacylase
VVCTAFAVTVIFTGLGAQSPTLAIVGATIVDGTGGAPTADSVVVASGSRIVALGPRSRVTIPGGARIVDGRGKFVYGIPVRVHRGNIAHAVALVV